MHLTYGFKNCFIELVTGSMVFCVGFSTSVVSSRTWLRSPLHFTYFIRLIIRLPSPLVISNDQIIWNSQILELYTFSSMFRVKEEGFASRSPVRELMIFYSRTVLTLSGKSLFKSFLANGARQRS